jgi:hypothetical protein
MAPSATPKVPATNIAGKITPDSQSSTTMGGTWSNRCACAGPAQPSATAAKPIASAAMAALGICTALTPGIVPWMANSNNVVR